MASRTVLLTGATGFVGSSTLRVLLSEDHTVHAVVRDTTKMAHLQKIAQDMNKADNLSFVVVPDFVAANAFDEAVQGVRYTIHIASPVPFKLPPDEHNSWERNLVFPAVQGTLSMLEAAHKVGCVKRIVVTSSLAAIFPESFLLGQTSDPIDAATRQPDSGPPYQNHVAAYMASKAGALNAAEGWIKTREPSFDVIHLHPAYVLGRDLSATTSDAYENSSNSLILSAAKGQTNPQMSGIHAVFIDVEDNAQVHVGALDSSIPGNQSFIVSNSGRDGTRWEQVPEIVAKHFPKQIEDSLFPKSPTAMPTLPADVRVGDIESLFGVRFAGFEDVVKSALGHYIELLEREKGEEVQRGG